MRRAIHLTGWLTVGIVVREDQFQVGTTKVEQLIRFRRDDHSRLHHGTTRREKLVRSFDRDKTHAAGSGRLQLPVTTQIRDVSNPIVNRYAEQGLGLISLHRLAIDNEGEAWVSTVIAHHEGLRHDGSERISV